MTTAQLKDPLNLKGSPYAGDRLLAEVSCRLSPADAPVSGMALVPEGLDWLSLTPLILVLRNGQHYALMPARLDPAGDGKSFFRFYIRP